MKETNEKVYRCDHCNKAIVSKGSMVVHEKSCRKNPNNKHKCFEFCKHLIEGKQEMYCGEESNGYRKTFHCKFDPETEIYSYKMEKTERRKQFTKWMKRMPIECDKYEDLNKDIYFEGFLE